MPHARYNHEQEPDFRIYYDSNEVMTIYPSNHVEPRIRPGTYICPACGRRTEYSGPHLDIRQTMRRECNDCRQKRYREIFAQRQRELS